MQLNTEQLTRGPDGYIAGVCEGLARRFEINANLLRIIWLAAVLVFGTGLLMYAVMWWIMPRAEEVPVEPAIWQRDANGRHRPPLARTTVDRRILGVCGGIARRWQFDPTLVRLAALSVMTLSAGIALLAYFIAALVMHSPSTSFQSHPIEL